jgi:hypothetical protein
VEIGKEEKIFGYLYSYSRKKSEKSREEKREGEE